MNAIHFSIIALSIAVVANLASHWVFVRWARREFIFGHLPHAQTHAPLSAAELRSISEGDWSGVKSFDEVPPRFMQAVPTDVLQRLIAESKG